MSHRPKPTNPKEIIAWAEYHVRQEAANKGNDGTTPPPPPGAGNGLWVKNDAGQWVWISVGDDDDSGSTTSGVSYPPRTVAEDLELLRGKLPIDIELMTKEYELRGFADVKIEGIRFKNAKELQAMDEKARMAYMKEQLRLTAKQEVAMMIKSHENAIELQELKAEIDRVMQSDQNDWQEAENELGRDLDRELQGLDIESREAISAAQIAAQRAISAAEIASREGLQAKALSHAEKMQIGQQAFDKVMQEKGFEDDKFLQARDLAMRLTLNKNTIASQEKIARERNALDVKMQEAGFAFQREESEKDREAELRSEVNALRGTDPVRAALLAMGVGDPSNPIGGDFQDVKPLENADILQADTESALAGIAGLGKSGEAITLGEQGVSGLQDVEKAAASFTQGPASTRTLVTSAQGVGNQQQSGVSEADVQRRISAVTPKGFDNVNAAEGAGLTPLEAAAAPRSVAGTRPIQENTVYQAGESGPEALVVGQDQKLEKIVPLSEPVQAPTMAEPNKDPLVNMFNDPSLTLNRGESFIEPYKFPSSLPTLDQTQQPNFGSIIMTIKKKRAAGIPLTADEEAFVARNNPRIFETENPIGTQLTPIEQQRRQNYLAGLKPAEQAKLMQAGRKNIEDNRAQVLKNLSPEVIQRLMSLINNPSRSVNNNLEEQLPQIRDGTGNIINNPVRSLTSLV